MYLSRPLASLPLYSANSPFNNTDSHPIYGDLPSFNNTKVHERMANLVEANIAIQKVVLQDLANTLDDGTSLRIFDTYSLINGLIDNPVPVFGVHANTTGFCACSDSACTPCSDPERYLWQNSKYNSGRAQCRIGC